MGLHFHSLLRYLKGTMNVYLHYNKSHVVLKGFCNANYVSVNNESNLTCGYVFTLDDGAISWNSSKHI